MCTVIPLLTPERWKFLQMQNTSCSPMLSHHLPHNHRILCASLMPFGHVSNRNQK